MITKIVNGERVVCGPAAEQAIRRRQNEWTAQKNEAKPLLQAAEIAVEQNTTIDILAMLSEIYNRMDKRTKGLIKPAIRQKLEALDDNEAIKRRIYGG